MFTPIDLRQKAWGMQILVGTGIYYTAVENRPVPRINVAPYYDVSPTNSFCLGVNYFISIFNRGMPAMDWREGGGRGVRGGWTSWGDAGRGRFQTIVNKHSQADNPTNSTTLKIGSVK